MNRPLFAPVVAVMPVRRDQFGTSTEAIVFGLSAALNLEETARGLRATGKNHEARIVWSDAADVWRRVEEEMRAAGWAAFPVDVN